MQTRPTIAHSVSFFLFLTGSWIYNVIINEKKTHPIVFAENRENEAIFPFKDLYCENKIGRVGILINSFVSNRFSLDYSPFRYIISKIEKVKIIHSHFGNRGYYDLTLAKKLKVPHLISFYGYDAWQLPKMDVEWITRYKTLFSRGDLFLAEGHFMLNRLCELGCPADKARVLKIGVDLNTIEFIPRQIGKDGLVNILIAGTFTEKKGIPYALEAIGKLKDRFPNIRVVIIGDSSPKIPSSFEEKTRIINIINKYGMESIVSMLGYQPYTHLINESKSCHIFLSPSVHAKNGDAEGGCPVIITEMSAAGMPIISTHHCDIPDVVIDGKTGFLAKEKDTDELAAKIEHLIENSNRWREIGEAGRKHVESEFNLFTQVDKLEDLYLEFL